MQELYVLSISDGTTPPEFTYLDTNREKCIELANRWCQAVAPKAQMFKVGMKNDLIWANNTDAPRHHKYIYAIITAVIPGDPRELERFEMALKFHIPV